MATNNLIKRMTDAGITASSDGGLRDFVARGNYLAAVGSTDVAIARRYEQIEFLKGLKDDLRVQVLDDQDVLVVADSRVVSFKIKF